MSKAKNENQEPTSEPSTDLQATESVSETVEASSRKDTSESSSKGGAAALWLALLSLMLSALLCGAAYYFWTLQQQVQQAQHNIQSSQDTLLRDVNSKMTEVGSSVSQIRSGFDEMKTGDQNVLGQLEQRLNVLNTQQQGQTEKIESLSSLVGRSTQEWALAEITYLTRLANQRVQLHRDTESAMIALKNADEQLAGLSDPRNTPVREQLARDIEALKSVPRVDMTGMAAMLGALLEKIDQLPVKNNHLQSSDPQSLAEDAESEAAETEPLDWRSLDAWKAMPGVMWDAVRELVTIRELDEPVAPMLPANEEYFLKQNLRLQMEATRMALLREDTQFYEQSLTSARDWIGRYFNDTNQNVIASLESLDELLSVNIKPEMPDISGSLRALEQYMEVAQ